MLSEEWTDGFSHDVEDSNGSGPISGSLGFFKLFQFAVKNTVYSG